MKVYSFLTASIFALVAVGHLVRLIKHMTVMAGSYSLPMAGSWIGLIVAAALSYWGFSLMSKKS